MLSTGWKRKRPLPVSRLGNSETEPRLEGAFELAFFRNV
jgi:hypothetical protein